MPVVTVLPCQLTSRGRPVLSETNFIKWPCSFDDDRRRFAARIIEQLVFAHTICHRTSTVTNGSPEQSATVGLLMCGWQCCFGSPSPVLKTFRGTAVPKRFA